MNGAMNRTMPKRHRARAVIAALLVLVLAAAVQLLAVASASASERVALVIGNSAYSFAPELKNPRNDAEALAASLNRLGFRVIKGIDADRFTMSTLVRAFSSEMKGAKIALFYYAGHGLQLNGKNYLIPVDARLESEVDLDFEAMDVNFVLRQMERDDRINIVLLDACRNNPLSDKLARSMGARSVYLEQGLARVETGVGSLVAFSTQPGNVALDGKGANSPFAKALLDNIEAPGVDIEVLMRRVREEVIKVTDGRQVPWTNSSLVGDKVVLNTGLEAARPVISEPVPQAAPPVPPAADSAAAEFEITFWKTVRSSKNPALIKAYLEKYPKGDFALIAQAMLAELESGEKPGGTDMLGPSGIPLPREKPQVDLRPREPPPAQDLQPAPQPRRKSVAPPPKPAKKKVRSKKKVATTPTRKAKPEQSCGLCYECATQDCRIRRRTCGYRYRMVKQKGLCQNNR